MTVRIDPTPDGLLEIAWFVEGERIASKTTTLDKSMPIIRYLCKQDISIAEFEHFEPQLIREARIELSKLQENNPWEQKP